MKWLLIIGFSFIGVGLAAKSLLYGHTFWETVGMCCLIFFAIMAINADARLSPKYLGYLITPPVSGTDLLDVLMQLICWGCCGGVIGAVALFCVPHVLVELITAIVIVLMLFPTLLALWRRL